MAEKLSIDERLALLAEAEDFFSDLSATGEDNEKLWLLKAAALGTVRECLEIYKDKALVWAEWTETTLKMWVVTAIEEDYIESMIEMKWMTEEEAEFYKGGFGLAIGILEGDKESIDGLKELEKEYDNILELKSKDKTIADLLK